MTEEIKAKLDLNGIKDLENYITNLQKEKDDYKLRNEKAIEYIEERKKLNWYADGAFVYELLNWDFDDELSEMSEYEMRNYISENYGIELYTYDELQKVMHEANYDGTQGITDIILEDYF